jgi:predicted HTH domain antitoxin
MPKSQKTLSIRVDSEDFMFLDRLAKEEREDVSKAVRDLMGRGRVMLAVDRYKTGKASLGRAAEIAGVSVSEMMDLLAEYGVEANLEADDYRSGLENIRKHW